MESEWGLCISSQHLGVMKLSVPIKVSTSRYCGVMDAPPQRIVSLRSAGKKRYMTVWAIPPNWTDRHNYNQIT